MIVINLWGAPSSGKSTTAAGLFFLMKINKFKVELVAEFAKDLVWDRHDSLFGNQLYIFAEQNRRLARLDGHGLDFAIIDSPIPLPAFYKPGGYLDGFDALVFEQFHRYNNLNYFLHRTGTFEKIGRRHNESESERLSGDLRTFMEKHQIEMTEMDANPKTPEKILADIQRRLPPAVEALPFALPLGSDS